CVLRAARCARACEARSDARAARGATFKITRENTRFFGARNRGAHSAARSLPLTRLTRGNRFSLYSTCKKISKKNRRDARDAVEFAKISARFGHPPKSTTSATEWKSLAQRATRASVSRR